MHQIKRGAELMMRLALLCSIATAQQQPESTAKSTTPTQLKPQTQTPPVPNPQPKEEVYGPYVPYLAPAPVQSPVSDLLPTGCATPAYVVPPGDVYGPY